MKFVAAALSLIIAATQINVAVGQDLSLVRCINDGSSSVCLLLILNNLCHLCPNVMQSSSFKAPITGSNLGQFQLLNTGRCLGSNDIPFSFTRYDFDFPGTYDQRVEACAEWCLQNGPPQHKMIALQVFTKDFNPFNNTGCVCWFDGPLGNPLPQYTPAFQDHGNDLGTLPIKTDSSQSWLCYKWKGTFSPTKAPSTQSPTKMTSFPTVIQGGGGDPNPTPRPSNAAQPTPRPSKVASKSAKKAKTKSAKSS